MRRPARLALGILTAGTLVLSPAMVGTSAAAPAKGPSAAQSAKAGPAKAAKPAKKPAKPAKAAKPSKPAKPSKAKAKVVVVGLVTDTPTVTTTPGSATSTVTIVVKVQGGDKEYRGKAVSVAVPSSAVVKRNHGKKTRYELKKGDKVTVHARRDAAGRLTATYVAASGRNDAPKPVVTEPAATNTATTTATTS